jgi:NAD(P)-dependent dehydrogenase (short-subunit alcohol dehydrogenase family)
VIIQRQLNFIISRGKMKGESMDLNLRGKSALVTGASAGIGLAAARELAAEGCRVVLVARTEQPLADAARAIRAEHGVEVEIAAADLSRDEAAPALAARYGDVDILVNNAGAIPGGTLAEVDQARWRAAWDLKVFGFIAMTRAFYARMQARRGGVIINIIGASGSGVDPRYIAGSTGNAALEAMTTALGVASPEFGVRVLGISPGVVLTERSKGLLQGRAKAKLGDGERWPELLQHLPFGRTATTAEISAAVAFLASERSGYTSGTIVTIDGGHSRRTNWWG